MTNFQQLIDKCRTIHRFKDKSIPEDKIHFALEQSLKSPNHRFTFPWKYYLLGEKSQQKVFDLAVELKHSSSATQDQLKIMRSKILNPRMVILAQKLNSDDFIAKEDYATMACSVQLMALCLAQNDLGYKWSTGKFTRDKRIYNILNIDEKSELIVGCILIGYPEAEAKSRVRPPLEDVLFHIP